MKATHQQIVAKIEGFDLKPSHQRFRVSGSTWETEWYFQANGREYATNLYLVIPEDFPEEAPHIFIEPEFYKSIQPLPHVDFHHKQPHVCVFDPQTAYIKPALASEALQELLERAKSILRAGLEGKNIADFETEFQSYWKLQYDNEKAPQQGPLIIGDPSLWKPGLIDLITLDSSAASPYKWIVYGNDTSAKRCAETFLKSFPSSKGLSKKSKAVYMGSRCLGLRPPFTASSTTIQDQLAFLPSKVIKELFEESSIFAIERVELSSGKSLYLGYLLNPPTINGFRSKHQRFFSTIPYTLQRLCLDHYSAEKAHIRSAGNSVYAIQYPRKLAFIGLGSIGSKLAVLLQAMEPLSCLFIDPDTLSIDNLKRHALQLNSVGQNKAAAMAMDFSRKIPECEVQASQHKLVPDLIKDLKQFQPDICVMAIGHEQIERKIREHIYLRDIQFPILFVWVEPYLCAGHVLLLPPFTHAETDRLLFRDGLFTGNIISDETYAHSLGKLTLRESGCQTTYVPYSGMDAALFLAAVFPWIEKQLRDHSTNSIPKSVTWIGDLSTLPGSTASINAEFVNCKKGDLLERLYDS